MRNDPGWRSISSLAAVVPFQWRSAAAANFPERESLTAAVLRCQLTLADQELIDAGNASWLRFSVSRYNAEADALPPFTPPSAPAEEP